MPERISSKTVTARKAHRCRCCNAIAIQPGQEYQREVLANDGRVYTWVSCRDCLALTGEVWDWSGQTDDGITADNYFEWAEEFHDDPVHGEAARAFLARAKGEVL